MVTVPICADCNRLKSKDDGYLRDIIVMDMNCSESIPAQNIFNGAVVRSMRKNHSHAVKTAIRNFKPEPMFSPTGLFLGMAYSYPVDIVRLNKTLSLIVRGLYYQLVGKRLPNDCQFAVQRLNKAEFDEHWEHLSENNCNEVRQLGDDIFACIFMHATEENVVSHSWLWFYNCVCYFIRTCPSNYDIKTLTPVTT